jgi:hypothetical protein
MRDVRFATIVLAGLFSSGGAEAFDGAKYETLTVETIRELISGSVPQMPATLARLQASMAIGIEACEERAKTHPEDAALLRKAIADAPRMVTISAEALEGEWGDEGTAGDSVKRPLKDLDNAGVTRGYLDLLVHPARTYDFILAYAKTKDRTTLDEGKGELLEALEHLKKVSAAQ